MFLYKVTGEDLTEYGGVAVVIAETEADASVLVTKECSEFCEDPRPPKVEYIGTASFHLGKESKILVVEANSCV